MQTIISGKKPNKFQKFHKTLSVRDYESYNAYLASEAWRNFKKWYYSTSGLPTECLACGRTDQLELHHWTYDRAGGEDPCDVIPLCPKHHEQLHKWLNEHDWCELYRVKLQLSKCFRMKSKEAAKRFAPFRKMSLELRNKQISCPVCGKRTPRGCICHRCRKAKHHRSNKPQSDTECPRDAVGKHEAVGA